jgi:hypothetical protein
MGTAYLDRLQVWQAKAQRQESPSQCRFGSWWNGLDLEGGVVT